MNLYLPGGWMWCCLCLALRLLCFCFAFVFLAFIEGVGPSFNCSSILCMRPGSHVRSYLTTVCVFFCFVSLLFYWRCRFFQVLCTSIDILFLYGEYHVLRFLPVGWCFVYTCPVTTGWILTSAYISYMIIKSINQPIIT